MPAGARTSRTSDPGRAEPSRPEPSSGDGAGGPEVFTVDAAYRDHAGVLYGYALHAVGDRAEAEDLVQEVFTRAWRAASRFDPERASVRTWLFAIARNLVLDAHRARGRRPRVSDQPAAPVLDRLEPSTPGPEDGVVERLRMVEALARISPEHREVVAAVHLDGSSYAELGAATGVPVATLRTRMHYGLRAMREVLAEVDRAERADDDGHTGGHDGGQHDRERWPGA